MFTLYVHATGGRSVDFKVRQLGQGDTIDLDVKVDEQELSIFLSPQNAHRLLAALAQHLNIATSRNVPA